MATGGQVAGLRWQHGLSTLPSVALAGTLPGLLAGVQVTGLLFFLNTHLEFSPLPVVRGFVSYGWRLGLLSLALHLPFTWGRPRRAWRLLPWSLTLVLALAAATGWVHASVYTYFLPPGINRRLLKAAVWLSMAALIGFYTALAHRSQRRPYGLRSRLLYCLLALASTYVVIERREAFEATPPRAEPRSTTVEPGRRPRLIVVGLEGASLDAILPLAERGRLPFFGKMLQEGAHGRLSALRPPVREAIWTSLATGKYPYRHGILGRRIYDAEALGARASLRLLPLGLAFDEWGAVGPWRAVDGRDLGAVGLWQVFSRLDAPTAVVSWPLTSPPRPGAADFLLTERFFEVGERSEALPPELAERARLFRTEVTELPFEDASLFGTEAPAEVLENLSQDLWRESLSFFLLDQYPQLEALFLVLPGLSKMSLEYYGAFSAVSFEGDQNPESTFGAQLLRAYYDHLDEFLAALWARTPPPRLLVVTSPRGTEPLRGYREIRRLLSRQPAMEGSFVMGPSGVLMMMGEGVRPGASLRQAEIIDLAPTLLYSLGFPLADDLDGKLLTEAFDTGFLARQTLTFIPSYESLPEP